VTVASSSALAGAVLGYVQFSAERWRGKLGYLQHRGTGVDGAFFAKAFAGLFGTALVGIGPPFLYALAARLSSPNAPIIQWSLLPVYASAATGGASLYGLGALAAGLRRRVVAGILLIVLGACGLWVISELCGTPWGRPSSDWTFPVLHLASAIGFLALARRLARSGVDRELPLPRGVHAAILALALPLVLFPLDIAASTLQTSLLRSTLSDYPLIVRDRGTGEFFPVVVGEGGERNRLEPDGRIGEPIEFVGGADPTKGFDTAYWVWGNYGASAAEPPPERTFASQWLTRRGLTPITLRQHSPLLSEYVINGAPANVRAFLDRERGTVRAFGFVFDRPSPGGIDAGFPFAIEIGKPGTRTGFSPRTFALDGQGEAVQRLIKGSVSEAPTPPKPTVRLFPCLADPEDGSLWRLDVLDRKEPLARVELPAGDRVVRFEPLYRRNELLFGRYQDTWSDPVVVGERGRYAWNGREFEEYAPDAQLAAASEAASFTRFRVVVDDPDLLRPRVRVLDAQDGRELFAYAFAPRTAGGSAAATASQATILLRPPFRNALGFAGWTRRGPRPDLVFQPQPFADADHPGLWILDVAVALACAGSCARMLRKKRAAPLWIGVASALVLLLGPLALLIVWVLEPKDRTHEVQAPAAVREPALAIQSV
jgi:hypothetical protein